MKKIRIISTFFAIVTAIFFSSCENEQLDSDLLNNNNNGGEEEPAVFKVDFNSQTFVATSTQAVIGDGAILIQGLRGSNDEAVSLTAFGTTPGTYTGENAFLAYDATGAQEYQHANIDLNAETEEEAYNGSLVITSIDPVNQTISGTFSFTGYWSNSEESVAPIVFTNGFFENIPYTTQTIDPTDPEYFRATVDGELIQYSSSLAILAGDQLVLQGLIISPLNKIDLNLGDVRTPGTYAIVSSGGITAKYTEGEVEYNATGGSLVITANEGGYMTGTFSFTAEDDEGNSVQITQGAFNIDLP
jgi:hypothetical protein